MEINKIAEIDATELFADENGNDNGEGNVNWRYCVARATFSHRYACEFIVHIGSDADEKLSYYKNKIREMKAYGCTPDFISAYRAAKRAGAIRVLFHA